MDSRSNSCHKIPNESNGWIILGNIHPINVGLLIKRGIISIHGSLISGAIVNFFPTSSIKEPSQPEIHPTKFIRNSLELPISSVIPKQFPASPQTLSSVHYILYTLSHQMSLSCSVVSVTVVLPVSILCRCNLHSVSLFMSSKLYHQKPIDDPRVFHSSGNLPSSHHSLC